MRVKPIFRFKGIEPDTIYAVCDVLGLTIRELRYLNNVISNPMFKKDYFMEQNILIKFLLWYYDKHETQVPYYAEDIYHD